MPVTPEWSGTPEATPSPEPDAATLPERERRILDFEGRRWRDAGTKEEAIRAEFDLPAARYYQLLNSMLDRPEAVLFDPMLVRRLQRLRDARSDARSARVLGRPDDAATSAQLAHQ